MAVDWLALAQEYEQQPTSSRMRDSDDKIRRAPSTDQLKARRKMKRQADIGEPVSRDTQIATLLRKAARSENISEQQSLVEQAETLKAEARAEARESGWDEHDTFIDSSFAPRLAHELSSSSTDWMLDLGTEADVTKAHHAMVAEASLWFNRVPEIVKEDEEEFRVQASNLGQRLGSQYGDQTANAKDTFVTEALRLRSQAGIVSDFANSIGIDHHSEPGAPELAQKAPSAPKEPASPEAAPESDETPESDDRTGSDIAGEYDGGSMHYQDGVQSLGHRRASLVRDEEFLGSFYAGLEFEAASGLPEVTQNGYPTDVFSNLNQNGNLSPEQVSSNRAPQLQELADAGTKTDVNRPNDGSNSTATDNAPVIQDTDHDLGDQYSGKFPVSGSLNKESNMAQCPTCGGHGRVAVRKQAYSGLPEIDQIVNPNESPGTTPYPTAVAFPWILNPQQQVPATISQAEQQISERNAKSPLASQSSRYSAGRDASGWAGDEGAKGTDVPGEQDGGNQPTGSNLGMPDPVHGFGGDAINQPLKPYGAAEADDYTNNQGQNWQPGQDTHADRGQATVSPAQWTTTSAWKETVDSDPSLASAVAYVNARYQATRRANG